MEPEHGDTDHPDLPSRLQDRDRTDTPNPHDDQDRLGDSSRRSYPDRASDSDGVDDSRQHDESTDSDDEPTFDAASDTASDTHTEAEAVDRGVTPEEILRRRVTKARSATNDALVALRSQMSDEDALQRYGLDLKQLR